MANIFESAFMTLKNGMTMYFADGKARQLIDKLKALVDTKYGPDNPPPSLAGNIWYAACSTAAGVGAKVATTSTGDFVLQTGAMVRLKCTTANTASNPTISIDGSTAKTIQPKSGTSGMAYRWRAQEVIDLVYDGSNFIMSLGPEADTSFYGITKLSSATNSTAEDVAATPKAVKEAYDSAERRLDLYLGVEIPENSDLNDYTTPGVYYSPTAGRSASFDNTPTTSTGFKLVVGRTIASTRVFQIAILNDGVPTIYKRYYNDTWSAWIRSLDESWLPLSVSRGGTGATNATVALENLGGLNLSLGRNIPDNSDLNDYTTPGTYYCANGTSAATLSNVPSGVSVGFKLIVYYKGSNANINQELYTNGGEDFYIRYKQAATWYSWKRVLDTDDLPLSVANGGTGSTDAASALAALGGTPLVSVDNTANTSYTFSVSNGSRFVLSTIASYADGKGLYIFNTTSAGNITRADVLAAGGVSFSTATGKLTVTSTRTGTFAFLVFNGSVSLDT